MTTLPRKLVQEILAQAQDHSPNETCGFIIQSDAGVLRAVAMENVAEIPEQAFEMDDAALIELQKRLRDSQQSIYALYHSHPTAPAEPSAEDIQQSAYPEALYLIVSLNTKGVLELRGWQLKNGVASEEPLRI